MLGVIEDDYTVKVVDVFAMPQSGTGVNKIPFIIFLKFFEKMLKLNC